MVVMVVVVMWVHVVGMQMVLCLLLLLLLLLLAAAGRGSTTGAPCHQLALLLEPLLQMYFGVALLLVAPRELTPTRIALKRFLTCVRSDVCC
jgi:hypothetical protein